MIGGFRLGARVAARGWMGRKEKRRAKRGKKKRREEKLIDER
jgi:hypothetical protein